MGRCEKLVIMKRTITILKFMSAALLLFVMIPNEKFIAPVFLWLYIFFIGSGGILGMVISAWILISTIYLLFSSQKGSVLNDILSILAILILYIPICIAFKNIIIYINFVSWLTYLLFIIISVVTVYLLIKRLLINKYDE